MDKNKVSPAEKQFNPFDDLPGFVERITAIRETEKTKPYRFQVSLEAAVRHFQKNRVEGAALAVRAALVVMTENWEPHLVAPLEEAASILEAGIEPSRRAEYSKAIKGALGRPPFDDDDPWLERSVELKLLGAVIVELQLRCERNKDKALKMVVGNDAEAQSSLYAFRDNVKRGIGPKGSKRAFYDLIQWSTNDRTPPEAVSSALEAYRSLQGKKS